MTDLPLFLLIYAAVIFFELIPMIKKKDKKALWIYIPVLIITLTVNILHGAGMKIPSLSQPVKAAITKIFKLK